MQLTRRTFIVTCVVAIAANFLTAAQSQALIIFDDDFSGANGTDLNTLAPDTRPGAETWVSAGMFDADGEVSGSGAGSATLAFTPVDGLIYHLDASMSWVNNPSGTDEDWIALGFAIGQSSASGTNHRFINGTPIGKAWMLFRGDQATAPNRSFLGSAGSGTADGVDWAVSSPLDGGGDIDMRIVLDTTGGAGSWTATWLAKRPTDASFTTVRATATLLDENITSVGFARSNTGVDVVMINRFTLSTVPEPATATLGLLAFGGLGAMTRRRRA